MHDDTIAAIATPVGEGGIGIIRISGDDALSILENVFVPVRKSKSLKKEISDKPNENLRNKEMFFPESTSETIGLPIENRRLSYGFVVDEAGNTIDEVLAVYMKAPHTYTAEDVVEINCHGSVVALKKTLDLVLSRGARLAEPGEFTKRAFLNGRLDLSQAEAVIDLIKAKTERSFDAAMSQLSGSFSQKIREIRNKIMDVLVNVTVNIEYPDEDIEEITYEQLKNSLSQIDDELGKLIAGAHTGKIIKDGLRVAIIGKPNVGKSSLMNSLLKESRAIVTEIPGTTRDTIEEVISIKSIPVVLTDTAGIRETDDEIEKIGIERSKLAANNADLVIFVIDGSVPLSDEDFEIMEVLGQRRLITVLNKRDKGSVVSVDDIVNKLPNAVVVEAAIAHGDGLSNIEDTVESLVYGGNVRPGESLLVTNARHEHLLRSADNFINDALSGVERLEALDIIEIDIKEAYDLLGEILGETVSDDIINEVFSRFCLGK